MGQRKVFRDDNFFNKPIDGDVIPLKFVCTIHSKYGANLSAENYATEGSRFIRTSDIDDYGILSQNGVYVEESMVRAYNLAEGDFLISRSGTLGRGYLYKEVDGLCSYAGYLIKYSIDKKKANPSFIFYSTKTFQFNIWLEYSVIEATIGNINGEKYANLPLPIPSISQQNKIVAYLNKEVKKIDSLIEKKTKLLELLEEKIKATISHAVTKGLNPKAKMKPSGIQWLGHIPEHWEVIKLKFTANKIKTGATPDGYDQPIDDENEDIVNWFTPGDFQNDFNLTNSSRRQLTKEILNDNRVKLFSKNSIMFVGIGATLGKVGVSDYDFYTNQQVNIIELREEFDKTFIGLSLSSLIDFSKVYANSATLPILNQQKLGEIQIPVPNLNEQNSISNYLNKYMMNHTTLNIKITDSINLLKEKRTAIISAAINGEINM